MSKLNVVGTAGNPAHLAADGEGETLCGLSIIGLAMKPFFYVGQVGCAICRTLASPLQRSVKDYQNEGFDFRSDEEKENK